jgi:outer membrane protein assembly factor BamB
LISITIWRRSKIKKKLKLALLGKLALILILLTTISLTGCTGVAKLGWAGTMVYEYTAEVEGVDVDHAVLFVGTMKGELAAYDLLNAHAPLWALPLDGTALFGPPVASGDHIYIGTYGGNVYKLAVDNSEAPVPAPMGDQIVGGVAVGSDRVFVGTSDGVLHALNADNMEEAWRYPDEGTLTDRIWGTPIVDEIGGMVYFGAFDRKFYALDASNGSEAWTFEARGAIAGKPLIYNDKVYFGAFDRKFYALNKTDGTTAWATPFTAGNWFWTEPVVFDGTIYVGCLDHSVYALDAVTGAVESTYKTDSPITSPPVIAGDKLIVASNSGKVYARDVTNLASEKWPVFNLGESIQSPISVYADFVYVYGLNQTLTARWLTTGGQSGWSVNTGL